MSITTADDYLSRNALLRLLAVLALVLAPHLVRIPVWLAIGIVAIGLWRATATLRQWALPPRWLKVAMVVIGFLAVTFSYGRLNGQHAGTALLITMLALKLTEMRSRRDVLVVVALCYFTMMTHFLFSQEMWTSLYLFACAIAVTAMLIEANHAGGLPPARSLRRAAGLVLQALPLMLVLFVLFPRVPGPLWGLPADAGAARSGIADNMSPGDISRLIQSDEIAFRVRFSGEPPPMNKRYWRGPVYWYFDGRTWRAPFRGDEYFAPFNRDRQLNAYQPARAELLGDPIRYEVTLEPHRQNWMFALDLPTTEALPPGSALTGYYQLLSRELVKESLRYETVSYSRFRLEPDMEEQWQRSAIRLPADRNPRAVAMGRAWRDEGLSQEQIVNRALRYFREQEFYYTLEPPSLGDDMVDEFLFGTRRGFCEHYAGSFTVLMRAAGIPARVVAGYQGGELNQIGDYYVVRQSDAHAWSEVWLPGGGWQRVDPTAAVAPERIEVGLSAAVPQAELPGFLQRGNGLGLKLWRLRASVAWDYANVAWDRWVIGFNPQSQLELLSPIGLGSWENMVIALTILVVGFMSIIGLLLMRRMMATAPDDAAQRLWRRATRRLARSGFTQAPGEGPRDYVERILTHRPDWDALLRPLLQAYLSERYLLPAAKNAERLDAAVKALKALRESPRGPETTA